MENNNAAILVLAIVAALVVTATGAYAMGRQTGYLGNTGSSYPSSAYGSGFGPSMMGGSTGYRGGMMGGSAGYSGGMMGGFGTTGGYGMMGASNGMSEMREYMWHYWNSSSVP